MHKSCGAVIVDNRHSISHIAAVNHSRFIPDSWPVILFREFEFLSNNDYNRILTSTSFWKDLKLDKVLIFQHDSQLLRHGIEEFLEYDFIGAPLYHIPMPAMNGGLSLRNTSKMLEIIEKYPYQGMPIHGNEDIYFCNHMNLVGGKLPTKEVAQQFSVETIFELGSLGVHAIEKWHTPEKCEEILNQYK